MTPEAPSFLYFSKPDNENTRQTLVAELRAECRRIGETAVGFKAYVDAALAKPIYFPAAKTDVRLLFR